ncbi:cell division ATP-binding protein FtsE [Marinobacterium nitratireducens]|uniref:Cell division ATP-binding protein FtsE n=1 Tax=Marinobacterium nitratireducens TaxID=518897 RepID=A0A918DQ14_9GAMM|nr:cell division ATP-binding protein FtsE [Marinobacterium nitratireducens]GGO77799.1 cell division ATP-binding protein FtsE [Marinobacterium nitratireducens]
MALISFDNVSKRYPSGQEALSNVSFTLREGEMAFLTGHSGAGKSTLLRMIMLMERPSQGQLVVGDQNLSRLPRRELPYHRRRIGVVFQNHQLLFDRSVFDNVVLPLQICGYDTEDASRRVRAALNKVGLLDKERLNPISLSSGEQQRVGIARAIVHKPQVLLADEPTGNLDPQLSEEIMKLFQQFNRVGTTVLIASHDLGLIERMRHRTLVLRNGRLIADGRG